MAAEAGAGRILGRFYTFTAARHADVKCMTVYKGEGTSRAGALVVSRSEKASAESAPGNAFYRAARCWHQRSGRQDERGSAASCFNNLYLRQHHQTE